MDFHVLLTLLDLKVAHFGIELIEADYLGSVNFGVVNLGASVASRVVVGLLTRLSPIMITCDLRRNRYYS